MWNIRKTSSLSSPVRGKSSVEQLTPFKVKPQFGQSKSTVKVNSQSISIMNQDERNRIIALVKREVVPAIGCTEPMAVALAVAKAKETLGDLPKQITVWLSANMLKNAMGVGIPGTGMIGLPIAIALGALIGKSEYSLEVLKETTPEDVERGKEYIAQDRIKILQKKDTAEKLYIEVECHNGDDNVSVIISGTHTHFTRITKNGR